MDYSTSLYSSSSSLFSISSSPLNAICLDTFRKIIQDHFLEFNSILEFNLFIAKISLISKDFYRFKNEYLDHLCPTIRIHMNDFNNDFRVDCFIYYSFWNYRNRISLLKAKIVIPYEFIDKLIFVSTEEKFLRKVYLKNDFPKLI